jgi:hypothetical protein
MPQNKLSILKDFIAFCKKELNIQTLPKISLIKDKSFVEQNRSYGEYNPQTNAVKVFVTGRNLADICRSLAHELCHHRQNELNMIYDEAGNTGTDIENDANAMAGIIMRDYGKLNLNVYDLPKGESLNEVGEGTKAFPWRFDEEDADGNYFYLFSTDKHKYAVGIANLEDGMYELSFNTVEHSSLDTNEGVMLRVLSTVVEITKDFIQRVHPEGMYFRPIKTGGPEDSRRGRIYAAYLKKNLPSDYSLMTTGDTFRVIKK